MHLWLTPVTTNLYIIASHVVLLSATGALCAGVLYLLTVANLLHLSHFVQVEEVIVEQEVQEHK